MREEIGECGSLRTLLKRPEEKEEAREPIYSSFLSLSREGDERHKTLLQLSSVIVGDENFATESAAFSLVSLATFASLERKGFPQ